jgi:hypothetical protein
MLVNSGEADERFAGTVTARWKEATLVASDALPGWSVHTTNEEAVFTAGPERRLRLSPGEQRGIGWLRYDRDAQPQLEVAPAITR